jgi:hypothetical protein
MLIHPTWRVWVSPHEGMCATLTADVADPTDADKVQLRNMQVSNLRNMLREQQLPTSVADGIVVTRRVFDDADPHALPSPTEGDEGEEGETDGSRLCHSGDPDGTYCDNDECQLAAIWLCHGCRRPICEDCEHVCGRDQNEFRHTLGRPHPPERAARCVIYFWNIAPVRILPAFARMDHWDAVRMVCALVALNDKDPEYARKCRNYEDL